MRTAFIAALLVPMLALAAADRCPVTVVPDEHVPVLASEPVTASGSGPNVVETDFLVGTVDTIGGTTYDWQANGPVYRMMANAPGNGVHVTWMFSASMTGTAFADRNMKYNYYDFTLAGWQYNDPDFMASGINVFSDRTGYGSLDYDPADMVAVISGHQGTTVLHPVVARDMLPGAGIFDLCAGDALANLWPPIALDQNSKVHCACIIDDGSANRKNLYYTNVDPWCTWMTPISIVGPQPNPEFSDQNIAASKQSGKVCVTWVYSPTGYNQDPGFYRISNDGGTTWGDATDLGWPPAFGGDTTPSYHITSLFPFYDRADRLHIMAGVTPFYNDTNWILPAQIWHWCPDLSPQWSMVHEAYADSIGAAVGYNASLACRPSIGEDSQGNLFVAWEEFDPVNVEPGPPTVLRGDIFVAGSDDDGMSWHDAVKLTEGGTGSHRFPSVIDMAVDMAGEAEEVWIVYEIDQVAGFFVQSENIATNNPIIVHKVPVSDIIPSGVAEPGVSRAPLANELTATPNPLGGRTVIGYALARPGAMTLTVYDAAGRPVRVLDQGVRDAGRYRVAWDRRSDGGELVAAGVYFYTLATDDKSLTEKLIVVR